MSRPENISAAEAMLREASGRMMSSDQRARLRHAYRLERGTKSERREAQRICEAVEKELRAGLSETVALELARGGEVEETPRGPVRMKSRDGLQSLLEAKNGLTVAQYEAGLAFRAAWEVRSVDVGSQLGADGATGAHDNDRFVKARLTRAKALQWLGRIERAVAVQCSAEPACLMMLRRVAGDGFCISVFGEGRAYSRNLAALKRALDVVEACSR